jgi:Kdo2-lipid IVA lauroyltransferase/acyltransferase
MYYLLYGFLYLISLLPFFILYGISDFLFLVAYYAVGYRKKIVMGNLAIAFPDKSITERKKIARKFYSNFIDTLIESIKMLSLSESNFDKRCTVDIASSNVLATKGNNIHFHSGHQMNWEYANWVFAKKLSVPWVGIYMPISNKAVNKVFYDLRSKYKTVLVSTKEFKSRMHEVFRSQYSLALAADQNPGVLGNAYWLNFFSRPAPFVTGPDKGAIKNNAAVVFVRFVKTKRGHYHFETKIIVENAGGMKEGELTILYRDFLEETIRRNPDNYLWSHRRWKHEFTDQHQSQWIDNKRPL